MSLSPRQNRNDAHTVVLRPRASSAGQPLILGLKQGHTSYPRGSPTVRAAPTMQGGAGPPVRYPGPHARIPERPTTEGVDLLVRFGIDSHFGRVVTRTLIWFMMWQPVYVAFGVELEDADVTPVVEESTSEVTLPSPPNSDTVDGSLATSAFQGQDEGSKEAGSEEELLTNVSTEDTKVEDSALPEEGEGSDAEMGDFSMEDEESDDGGMGNSAASSEEEVVPADDEQVVGSDTGTEGASSEGGSSSEANGDTALSDAEDVTNPESESSAPVSGEGGDESASKDDLDTPASDDDVDAEESTESQPSISPGEDGDEGVEEPEAAEGGVGVHEVADIVNIAQNPTSKYTFGEGDCTLVADGEFYCIATDAERVRPGDPRVYAERDREGDREILYFDGVEVKRITNNNYDDFAPSFDEKTLRIVWQAMLNDRLQVMYHDIRTDTTRQITTSRQNSSNPHIKGDIIVWQEWVDNNWEIMMTNVRGGGELEIQRLTDNVMHDMFPQVYDGLITWQREKGRSWEVIVYDLQTGKEMALEKNNDTRYENPRFVLLFDSKHDNGDVQTIGYDLNTGEMMQLGNRSRPEPSQAPITPDSETPDALAREAASSTQIKVGRDGDDADDDLDIEL